LSSINTSEDSNGQWHHLMFGYCLISILERDLLGNYRNLFHRRNSIATDSISVSFFLFLLGVAYFF
jgi:hypothetical protein